MLPKFFFMDEDLFCLPGIESLESRRENWGGKIFLHKAAGVMELSML
jgi:hypothetical protein